MPLTDEQAGIAAAIGAEIDRLIKEGKRQLTILGLMQGRRMEEFKQLLDADVIQEAADRFPGFRHFAKILERLSKGISSGAIPVPGGRKDRPRDTGPMAEYRRLAAAMEQH